VLLRLLKGAKSKRQSKKKNVFKTIHKQRASMLKRKKKELASGLLKSFAPYPAPLIAWAIFSRYFKGCPNIIDSTGGVLDFYAR
jgi:hypothetical protein